MWRSSPRLWDGGHVITESCVVHLVDEDTEEGGGLFIWIGLGVDLDNEGGSDGGEQTSLWHGSIHVYLSDTHNIRTSMWC